MTARLSRLSMIGLVASFVLLSGCGRAGFTAAGVRSDLGAQAAGKAKSKQIEEDSRIGAELKRLHRQVFKGFDADKDGEWEPKDFKLNETRFLNIFHKMDTDDDRKVTFEEYYPPARHADLVDYVQARAEASASGVRGRVSFDKADFILDVYLQPYLNQDLRKKFIKQAFEKSDADDSNYLGVPELASAIGMLLAKADEQMIQKSVNRSSGQPLDLQPPE